LEKIISYHQNILEHLIEKHEQDSDFYFVPRKINNKNRLENGYWFLGNNDYCYLSFWNGSDWKEKIHNIGFVVSKDKKSYIELSAQDSENKAIFLSEVANELGGFSKAKNKNKWFCHLEGDDYLKNLEDFIVRKKPLIDKLFIKRQPEGMYLLNKEFYNKYCKKVIDKYNTQNEHGKVNKIARICWNTKNWKKPSGSDGKSISKKSYERENGFGHEEWLFDKSKILNGYQYGFLEPFRLKTNKHFGRKYNLTLYTKNNWKKKYLVGTIDNVICIDKDESRKIYNEYEERGYIDQMKLDIESVGGKWKTSIFTNPSKLFNIKFKFEDVNFTGDLFEISDEDNNITSYRFNLLPRKTEIGIKLVKEVLSLSEGNKQNTQKRKRKHGGESEYDPYHAMMQNALKDLLDKSDEYKFVQIEKDRVDLKALTKNKKWHYFELKTDNPKLSIRKAIGQIMEYAYYPNKFKADKLVIISDQEPDSDTENYLDFIRDNFNIPLVYRAFNLQTNELSKEY